MAAGLELVGPMAGVPVVLHGERQIIEARHGYRHVRKVRKAAQRSTHYLRLHLHYTLSDHSRPVLLSPCISLTSDHIPTESTGLVKHRCVPEAVLD